MLEKYTNLVVLGTASSASAPRATFHRLSLDQYMQIRLNIFDFFIIIIACRNGKCENAPHASRAKPRRANDAAECNRDIN